MPLKPTSFVPNIVKAIFEKYAQETASENNLELGQSIIRKNILVELSVIFGEELNTALRLLDEQQIIIYCLESGLREFVEITESRTSNVIRLFPGVNYCTCDFFAQRVLQLQELHKTEDSTFQKVECYTCPHVLAVQLATCLHLPVLRKEILPKHKFNHLLNGMLQSESF